MRLQHFRRLTFITLLSFCLAGLVNANSTNKDEIEQALTVIGSGSANELKSRLITDRITVFTVESRAEAVNALPAAIREQRLTRGRLLRRVEAAFQQVLELHGRSSNVELFLFHHDIPSVQFWHGCVLMISDCLAEQLYDGELAGMVAHELSHSYFEDEMAAAQRNRDTRTMRVLELKCDGVAILSLKLLGQNPALYLKGLQQIDVLNKRFSRSSGIQQSHPGMVVRAQFSERLVKILG